MMAPTISHARMPSGMLPPVAWSTFSALKNTPEPITIPTTMQMAVGRPYFFPMPDLFSSLKLFCAILLRTLEEGYHTPVQISIYFLLFSPAAYRKALPGAGERLLLFFSGSGPPSAHSPITWNTMSRTRSRVSHAPAAGGGRGPRILPERSGRARPLQGPGSAGTLVRRTPGGTCPRHSPITWNTMSRTRSRVSHSMRVRFCQGPTVIFPFTKGTVMKGDSSAALMWEEPLSSCQVSWCQ